MTEATDEQKRTGARKREESSTRRGGMRRLGAELAPYAAPILGKQGLGEAKLLSEWSAIVGANLAAQCCPVKLSFPRGQRLEGVLRLRVAPAVAVEIQHREPAIIERINGFFGYRAVARLAIIQGPPPLAHETAPSPPRPLSTVEREQLQTRVGAIKDPVLREALERLGSAIIGTR